MADGWLAEGWQLAVGWLAAGWRLAGGWLAACWLAGWLIRGWLAGWRLLVKAYYIKEAFRIFGNFIFFHTLQGIFIMRF